MRGSPFPDHALRQNPRGAFFTLADPRLMRFPRIILSLRRKFIDYEHLTEFFIKLPLWPN
jgi:hypothetical protein